MHASLVNSQTAEKAGESELLKGCALGTSEEADPEILVTCQNPILTKISHWYLLWTELQGTQTVACGRGDWLTGPHMHRRIHPRMSGMVKGHMALLRGSLGGRFLVPGSSLLSVPLGCPGKSSCPLPTPSHGAVSASEPEDHGLKPGAEIQLSSFKPEVLGTLPRDEVTKSVLTA